MISMADESFLSKLRFGLFDFIAKRPSPPFPASFGGAFGQPSSSGLDQ